MARSDTDDGTDTQAGGSEARLAEARNRGWRRRSACLGAVAGGRAVAQDATPVPLPMASPTASSSGISLAAGGLINPRGMAWASDGRCTSRWQGRAARR